MNYMSYNEKSDVWSVGCLLYELCALRPPFMAANQKELASRITTGRFARIPLRYSDNLNLVISTLLKVDVSGLFVKTTSIGSKSSIVRYKTI